MFLKVVHLNSAWKLMRKIDGQLSSFSETSFDVERRIFFSSLIALALVLHFDVFF